MKKVLVVDDEATLTATLRYNLEREGYTVTVAADGEAALAAARADRPDLVILDLMLPVMDGLEVCRLLRRESSAPILMLTAKAGEVDKVVGLELGADDYVTKPFGMRELIARVRALLRRHESGPAAEADSVSASDLRVDLRRREAFKGDKPLVLKPKEMELLTFFLRNRGRVFTRDQLLSQIWGYDYAANTRTIDVHVRWLRQKIEDDPDRPTRLMTIRGTGYRFDG
ncbi:MAG TPA: response regulator transcription factor [Dehalococcoidia bacterium]|nr:response regulator transcription factor [Dehalococcoidia bacterium]